MYKEKKVKGTGKRSGIPLLHPADKETQQSHEHYSAPQNHHLEFYTNGMMKCFQLMLIAPKLVDKPGLPQELEPWASFLCHLPFQCHFPGLYQGQAKYYLSLYLMAYFHLA